MNMNIPSLNNLSVVIPVAAGDDAWKALLGQIKYLPLKTEILLVCPVMPADAPALLAPLATNRSLRWITSAPGRAKQMNAGARAASRGYLWFLHSDSQFAADTITRLESSLQAAPDALHYFNLKFRADGPKLTRLNDMGVRFRSQVLGLPFGDQGFCLSKENFVKLGEFPEDAAYGEDHLLVWRARGMGIPLACTRSTLLTSARKYKEHGWLATTSNHLRLTIKQAFPEWRKTR
jgi:hypothetical protein